MDVFSALLGQRFVWDVVKAELNLRDHGVSFETAREVFFDMNGLLGDASNSTSESRLSYLGLTFSGRLLFVVHVEREGDTIRVISARHAERREWRDYEEDND